MLQQQRARGSRGVAQRLRAQHDGRAAADAALIGGGGGIAHDHNDAATGTSSSSATIWARPVSTPMPISALPVKTWNISFIVDAQPGVQTSGRWSGGGFGCRRKHLRRRGAFGEAETDQKPAGILDKFSSETTFLAAMATRSSSFLRRPGERRRKCAHGCRSGRPEFQTRCASVRR